MDATVRLKIDAFFADYPLQKLPEGKILCLADEQPTCTYYVASGAVCAYDITEKGHEVIISTYKPPSFFPLAWTIGEFENYYFFKTIAETELRTAPRDAVVSFLKQNPDVMFEVFKHVSIGVEVLLGRLKHLMGGSTFDRLVHELALECHQFGKHKLDGSWFLAMSESELAARSGLARETVSREIQKLKHLLEVNRHGITIRNLEKLEQELK